MNELSIQKNKENYGVEANSSELFQHNQKDSRTDYFSERAKKLTTAVYIITNLMPQTDPLRLTIRKFSIKLLSLMGLSVSGQTPEEISSETVNLSKKIVELLEVAFFSGYISEMNFSVVKTEFDLFMHEIERFEGSQKIIHQDSLKVLSVREDQMSFNTPGFDSHKQTVNQLGLSNNPKGQKQTSDFAVSGKNQTPKVRFSGQSSVRKAVSKNSYIPSPAKGVIDAKKVSRKEAIISIIKMKGEVSIKDISSVVINCSEKTIQRELIGMVSEGILRKTGDRRWSVYSLAK